MSIFDKIIAQSPWLIEPEEINRDIHIEKLKLFPFKFINETFLEYNFKDGVYIVTGPRQVGKTTLLKVFIQKEISPVNNTNFLYFNCDLLDAKKEIVEIVEVYFKKIANRKKRIYVILDEITSVKDSFIAIKFLVDSGFEKNITYILSGSNTIGIKKTGEYLPGRRGKGIDFVISPLGFNEYLSLVHPNTDLSFSKEKAEIRRAELEKKIPLQKSLENYLMHGGIPRVINEFEMNGCIDVDIFEIYRSWIASEIAKSEKKEHIVKLIFQRCINSLSSDTSYNAFAQDAGIGSHNTVYDYLDFLERAHILCQIFNRDIYNQKINYRKNKKIFFSDPFVYSVIDFWLFTKQKQDFKYLKNPIEKSRHIENLVFLKLKSQFKDVYFYKDKNEIDFITEGNAFEVKCQNRIINDDLKTIKTFKGNKFIISKKDLAYVKEYDLFIVPIELFLLLDL